MQPLVTDIMGGMYQTALRMMGMSISHDLQRRRRQRIVRIQKSQQRPRRQLGTPSLGISASLIPLIAENLYPPVRNPSRNHFLKPIRRRIVYQDDLPVPTGL